LRGGDLSNESVPKIVLVFEGALGFIDRKDQGKCARYIHRKRWREAADMWILNELMMQRIWYATRHLSQTIEVVTFAGPEEFGEALEFRLQDEEELPVHRVWATRPELLARKLTYMPDLAVVYDPDPARWLTWGPKGRILTDPNQLGAL
jgi:hypothetical protein